MAKDAPLAVTVIICLLILVLVILAVLGISAYEKFRACHSGPDYWCWNDWTCDALGSTTPIPKCSAEQEEAGSLSGCYSAKAVYNQFYNKCDITGATGATGECPCAFAGGSGIGPSLCPAQANG